MDGGRKQSEKKTPHVQLQSVQGSKVSAGAGLGAQCEDHDPQQSSSQSSLYTVVLQETQWALPCII